MAQGGTEQPGTGQGAPSRALVADAFGEGRYPPPARDLRRPHAGFLTQLIVSADPGLRASRCDRTRVAAARYAEAARRRA